jgi:APA family basic amino acid/polyamine antiporter
MSQATFQQRLGLFDATMLVAGSMIGSGIFIVSAEIARDVGSAGWLMVVWLIAGVMTVLGALAYAELAAMMPQAGGQYVYLREAYGPLWGFLYGWTSFTVIQTGTIAAVAVAFAKFLGVFAPTWGTGEAAVLLRLEGFHWVIAIPLPWADQPLRIFERSAFTITRGQLVAVGLIWLLSLWNCRGVQSGKIVQNIFTVAKIGALVVLIGLGLTLANSPEAIERNTADWWGGLAQTRQSAEVARVVPGVGPSVLALMVVGGALVGALFSADAWNNVTFTAGETRDPQRVLPLSLMLGTGLVIGLYLLANLAYLAALPISGDPAGTTPFERGIAHAQDDRVGTALMEQVAPGAGVSLMALAILISTFGCVNGMILMGARLYYAMATDRLFFRQVGTLNRNGVPAAGLLTQAAWASLLVFSGTYGDLLDYVIFAALLFYALTVAGLFVLRVRQPHATRPYRAVGYPILPAVYILLCTVVMLDLLVVKPKSTWPGLILVATGVPVYWLWSRLRQPATRGGA